MSHNTDHLVAIMTRLANETARHGDNPKMAIYLAGIRRELDAEEAFLAARGVNTYAGIVGEIMTDDEIIAELMG